MADVFAPSKRRRIMQKVRREGTAPERAVADYLTTLKVAFWKNVATLPGTPDLVVPNGKTVVFVNGCFWHGHASCPKGRRGTQANRKYWQTKIDRNRRRDRRVARALRAQGWSVITLWECELRSRKVPTRLMRKLFREEKDHNAR